MESICVFPTGGNGGVVIKCYDVFHTQGKEYLVEDITDYVHTGVRRHERNFLYNKKFS